MLLAATTAKLMACSPLSLFLFSLCRSLSLSLSLSLYARELVLFESVTLRGERKRKSCSCVEKAGAARSCNEKRKNSEKRKRLDSHKPGRESFFFPRSTRPRNLDGKKTLVLNRRRRKGTPSSLSVLSFPPSIDRCIALNFLWNLRGPLFPPCSPRKWTREREGEAAGERKKKDESQHRQLL